MISDDIYVPTFASHKNSITTAVIKNASNEKPAYHILINRVILLHLTKDTNQEEKRCRRCIINRVHKKQVVENLFFLVRGQIEIS